MKTKSQATVVAIAIGIGIGAPSIAQDLPDQMPVPAVAIGAPGPLPVVDAGSLIPDPILAVGETGGGPEGNVTFAAGPGGGFAGLDLSDEQYEKIFALKQDEMVKSAASRANLMAAEVALHDLLLSPTLDTAKIQAAEDHINQLRTQAANARLQNDIARMAVLTPQQREILHKRIVRQVVDGGMMGMRGPRVFVRRMGAGRRLPPHPPVHPAEHESGK